MFLILCNASSPSVGKTLDEVWSSIYIKPLSVPEIRISSRNLIASSERTSTAYHVLTLILSIVILILDEVEVSY
jgi:hypothetical protein